MEKIKIISNPYKKEIRYQQWVGEYSLWKEIDYENNGNSELLNRELKNGFFPFIVKKIVDVLCHDYYLEGEPLQIFFEGSSDEYKELVEVSRLEKFCDKVSVSQASTFLPNARDILPAVKNLFAEMSPLILHSTNQFRIERDLDRFRDASSDVVPICVLGNYSTGKSTFINALIGSEILPNGDLATTDKIYKISRSGFADRAYVRCEYLGVEVKVQYTEKDTFFEVGALENHLSKALKQEMQGMGGTSITSRVRKTLLMINEYQFDEEEPEIGGLIEVEIPFVNGVLAETQHPFVIFDTPGSNSSSHIRHGDVLKKSMENMTNGLPIYVAVSSSLDSTDNEKLYQMISEMKELDNRFTMIVVNKADGTGIPRQPMTEIEQKKILNQAVPRNLYSGGLFYVSSIIGLGSKTNGEFIDYCYEDVFDAQASRYKDKNNKHSRSLYMINIQPEQLKRRADILAEEQDNPIYANSGLFTIEKEIEEFAGKYSAYNKCFQSQLFLSRVIKITAEEIEEKKQGCEDIRKNINEKLESDKKELIDKIGVEAEIQSANYVQKYPGFMEEFLVAAEGVFTIQDLQLKEAEFTKEQEETLGFDKKTDEAKKAKQSIGTNFLSNMTNAVVERKGTLFLESLNNLYSDVDSSRTFKRLQKDTRHQADKQAADSLLQYVVEKYGEILSNTYEVLDAKSQEYWTAKTKELQSVLAKIVTGSEVLTESRRKELERIIITYPEIVFDDESVDVIFNKENFERQFKIGEWIIWKSDHLNIEKLVETYNSNIISGVMSRYECIEDNHKACVFTWIQNLLDEIYENIVEYSPELSKQARQIKMMTERISELENDQLRLVEYTKKLVDMMDWKKVE